MTRYDELNEVHKHDSEAKIFEEILEILKFNPYHDAGGRFASANGATSFTRFTNSPAGQKAIANIREREMAAMGAGGAAGGKEQPAQDDIGNTKKQKKHKNQEPYGNVEHDGPTDKTYAQVAKDLGVDEEEAKTMVDSIFNYSDGNYHDIRAASRGEATGYEDDAKSCEDFINKSPKWAGGQLQRGLKVYDQAKYDEMVSSIAEGKEINLRGISSWSSDSEVAENFAGGDYPVVLRTNKGSTTRGTSISHLSEYGPSKWGEGEQEVLISSKATFKPTKIKFENGQTVIYGDIQ